MLSALMLSAMRDNARAHGFSEVVAPVRPSAKHLEPHTPIEEYARRMAGASETSKIQEAGKRIALCDTYAQAQDILAGVLLPGTWLKQIDLERRYKCTRPEVRRALDRLAQKRLVEHVPNRGFRVSSFDRGSARFDARSPSGTFSAPVRSCRS